jgi:hypothetical protein
VADAQPHRGARVAGFILGVGDLAGDRAELGGDRRLGGGHDFEGVEDLVVFAADPDAIVMPRATRRPFRASASCPPDVLSSERPDAVALSHERLRR